MKGAVLFSSYFPPVLYFMVQQQAGTVIMDICEHYQRQTFRNRCEIYGPEGIQKLSIPVVHNHKEHTPVKDTRIANTDPWQIIHWRTLESAYRRSPFFEFYEDQLRPFFDKKQEWLWEFNHELLLMINKLIGLSQTYVFPEKYENAYPEKADFRSNLQPKKKIEIKYPEYMQVFSSKKGFLGGLSIIDVLFNEGPKTLNYIEACNKLNPDFSTIN